MAQPPLIYEQQYRYDPRLGPTGVFGPTGWFDDTGLSKAAWWDADVTDPIIPLYTAMPSFWSVADTFMVTEPITLETFPALIEEPDTFFRPMSARALQQGAQMLRNEVRRIR